MAPTRTCVGCRTARPADELVRVTRDVSGALVLGRTQPGRGAWLCPGSPSCWEAAVRRRAFERALRRPLAPDALAGLAEALERHGHQGEGSEEPGC